MPQVPADVPGFSGDAMVRRWDGEFVRVVDLKNGVMLEDGQVVSLVVEMPFRPVYCVKDPQGGMDRRLFFAAYQPISSNAHSESRWVFPKNVGETNVGEMHSPTFSLVLSPDTRNHLGYGWVYLYSPVFVETLKRLTTASVSAAGQNGGSDSRHGKDLPRASSSFRSRFAIRATTLGHGMEEGILDHPFFGRWSCVSAIQHFDPEGACLYGYVKLNGATFVTGATAGCKATPLGEAVVEITGALPMGYERPKRRLIGE